ncbi:MAG: leucyl aminopeptidase, partial [Pseudomonadota bacterium]|nr:leucyl aminopeptidase [Pseudomonadota bacterium]
MDFKHQVTAPAGLAGIDVDALVLVVGDRPDTGLAAPLAALIAGAVSEGDLVLKKGKLLYLYQPARVAARRVAVAVAADPSLKAFKAAVALGLGALKSSGAKTVAIAAPGTVLGAAHAEAAVVAAADACYLYTHTKPSATPGWMPSAITLLCQKSEAKAVQQGLRQGAAVAAGVTMAREFGNRPGNACTPTWLGQQA